MDTTWTKSDIAYYVANVLGLLPFAGNGNKTIALLYSLFLWIFFGLSGVNLTVYHYGKVSEARPEFRMLMKVFLVEILLRFVVAIFSTAVSVNRSCGFCGLRDEFRRFDGFASRTSRPPGARPQALYLLYIFAVGLYNFVCLYSHNEEIGHLVMLVWNVLCASTMIPIVQYMTYVRMLRDRYELVNRTFANSVVKSNSSFSTGYNMTYPSEINSLYVTLHGLTEEVKTYYAYHVVLIVVESVIILISGVTAMTINFLNKLDTRFIYNGYFAGHCALRLLFLFYVVRETHSTVLKSKNTALIGHEALSMAISDTMTMKYVEIIVLNCWNHPIVFDVHDFFDLDYKLLQSIIASVVTYVVVLVQIYLAIIMEEQE